MVNERIITNPGIAKGPPIIRGTKIPVHRVLAKLADGVHPKEIVNQLPDLQMADIKASLDYAASLVKQQVKAIPGTAPLNSNVVHTTKVDVELDLKKILIVELACTSTL